MTAKEATHIALRIRHQLEQRALPHAESDVSQSVTLSMGIAESPGSVAPEHIIAKADDALYRAKRAGRNQWSF